MLYQAVFADSVRDHRNFFEMVNVIDAYAESGLVEKALGIASDITDTGWYCQALLVIAVELDKLGARDSALAYLKDISEATASIADSVKRNEIIRWLAYSYLSLNEIPMVRQITSSMLDKCDRYAIIEALAFWYVRRDSCEQALAMAEEINDPDELLYLKMSIADSCFVMGRKAIALMIVDDIGDSLSIGYPYVHSGGEYDAMTAISIYARAGEMEKAAKLAKQWEHTAFEPVALMKMAEGYIGLGEPKNALPLLSAARKACGKLRLEPNTQPSVEEWQKIVILYARAGAFSDALSTVREMPASTRDRATTLADIAYDFSKTGRKLGSAEKKELRQIISQYCK